MRYLSRPSPLYGDREQAGRSLAVALARAVEDGDGVVVGLARGGVVVAAAVAAGLRLPLDALAVRKVGHPWQPEYAIGAVAPGEPAYLRASDGLSETEVAEAAAVAAEQAERLQRRLHATRAALDVSGLTAILVDDGLATGATMTASVRWAQSHRARRVVAAAPVGATPTVAALAQEADEVVCPYVTDRFGAVGFWYEDFPQVEDQEVVGLLEASRPAGVPT